jgi:hypothetical protein
MDEQLHSFGKLAESIVHETKIMLANASSASSFESAAASRANTSLPPHQHHFHQSGSQSASLALSERDITSCRVWNSLDECDIYSACQVIVAAEAVLALGSRSSDSSSEGPSSFRRCLAARAAGLLQLSSSTTSSLPDPLLERCAGVQYLHQVSQ